MNKRIFTLVVRVLALLTCSLSVKAQNNLPGTTNTAGTFTPSMLQTKFQTENYCKLTKTKNNRWTNLSQSCCWLG